MESCATFPKYLNVNLWNIFPKYFLVLGVHVPNTVFLEFLKNVKLNNFDINLRNSESYATFKKIF